MPDKQVCTVIDQKTLAKLEKIAKDEDRSIAQLLRIAINLLLEADNGR